MSSWSAWRKLTVIFVGGIAAVVIVLFIVVRPVVADLSTLHQQTQDQKKLLHRLTLEEASYKSARADLSRIKGRVDEIEGLFPVREKLVGHIEKLEAAALEFGDDFSMSITDAKEDAASTGAEGEQQQYTIVPGLVGVDVIPYEFHLQGSYTSVVHFLQTLENQPFYSEIEKMSLSSQVRESGAPGARQMVRTGKVEATIRAAFYADQAAK